MNSNLKLVQRLGLGLFLAGFAIFLGTFFTSSYQLTSPVRHRAQQFTLPTIDLPDTVFFPGVKPAFNVEKAILPRLPGTLFLAIHRAVAGITIATPVFYPLRCRGGTVK